MIRLLYGLAALFTLLWILGFFVFHVGGMFIHLLPALALAAMVLNLFPEESIPYHRLCPRQR
jgi:hypothetical protein